MDLGADLHAGDEAQALALVFKVAFVEINQRTVRRYQMMGVSRLLTSAFYRVAAFFAPTMSDRVYYIWE